MLPICSKKYLYNSSRVSDSDSIDISDIRDSSDNRDSSDISDIRDSSDNRDSSDSSDCSYIDEKIYCEERKQVVIKNGMSTTILIDFLYWTEICDVKSFVMKF